MRVGVDRVTVVAVCALALAAAACEDKYKDGAALHARKVVAEREVEGLRAVVSRLERHEPMLPPGDVAVAIDEALVRGVIAAQLPLDVDVKEYRVRLDGADVSFHGSPVVRLRGKVSSDGWLGLEAQLDVIGALDRLAVDRGSSVLSAHIVIDHLTIEKASGLEAFLSGSTLDELGRMLRLEMAGKLPRVEVPVRVQQTIDLPAVTRGAVRMDGASFPLAVAVSQVTPIRGRLWIALHVEPGQMRDGAGAAEAGGRVPAGTPRAGS